MSFGDAESPPTYYFSGITFNPSFYTSDYITKETGKKYFLSYPIAQGTETISTLIASTINSSASNDTVNLFNNITTGTIYLGNIIGTTANLMGNIEIGNDTNNSTSANNGTCQINKLKVGVNGTPYRYMIMQTGIGAGVGSTNIKSHTIPNAPSGMGNPIVIASINQTSTTSVYLVMIEPTGTNTFNYVKRQLINTPLVLTTSNSESFSYVAYWL
jgi:hypothetical protein